MGAQGVWATWAMGHMGNRVQGYGVQDTWAMGTGSVGHMG